MCQNSREAQLYVSEDDEDVFLGATIPTVKSSVLHRAVSPDYSTAWAAHVRFLQLDQGLRNAY